MTPPVSDLVEKLVAYEGWTEASDEPDPMTGFTDKTSSPTLRWQGSAK